MRKNKFTEKQYTDLGKSKAGKHHFKTKFSQTVAMILAQNVYFDKLPFDLTFTDFTYYITYLMIKK